MPIEGVLHPNAENYRAENEVEDYTGVFLIKHEGVCHLFKDVTDDQIVDKSFTLSYGLKGGNWVFFHDYTPDYYMHSRENLFTLKENKVYRHNAGLPGTYYGSAKPFFIDVIFSSDSDLILESVQWVSEFLSNDKTREFTTLSHLSIWNSEQHTGRIDLTQILSGVEYDNMRKLQGSWSFDTFRDVLNQQGTPFLMNIFNDYKLIGSRVEPHQAWYEEKLLQDTWFCVRFEFDNTTPGTLVIHDTTIQALKTDR